MKVRVSGFALAAAIVLAMAGRGEAKQYLYVENSHSGDVTVISVPEHEVVSTIRVGESPDDVVNSSDGRVLYVNNQSDSANHKGEVVAISTETEEILWRAEVSGVPNHMSISPDDRFIYVPLFDGGHIDVIDTEKGEVTDRVFGVIGAHGTRLSPDGKRLYIGSMVTDAVYVVDLEENPRRPMKVVNFDDAVRPFAFTKNEKWMYVQLSRLHGFDVVDLEKAEIVKRVHLPELSPGAPVMNAFPHTWNHGLEISPNEKYLLAAGSASEYVAVYRLPDLEFVKTIPTGVEPNWIIFTDDGKYAYVTARVSDEISVIDMDALEEVKRIKSSGDYPQRMRVFDVPERTVSSASR